MSMHSRPIHAKLIANPIAGSALEAASRLKQVIHYMKANGVKVDVAYAAPKKEAINIARKAVKDGYDTVIALGGDGTICAVIRGIAGSKVHLGIIASGTMNDIAKSLGIPDDLKKACALIATDKVHKMDLGEVKVGKSKKFYFFQVVAVGLSTSLFPKAKKIPKGKLSCVKDTILTFLRFATKPKVFLSLDNDSKVEVKTMLVTVTNLPLVVANNLVAPNASADDGLLDISVFPGFSKAELINYFLKTSNEGASKDTKLQRYLAHELTVDASSKMEVAADGINVGKGVARIKISNHPLYVIAPKPTGKKYVSSMDTPKPLIPTN
jgi:diacylglycerol kinase (ATP)